MGAKPIWEGLVGVAAVISEAGHLAPHAGKKVTAAALLAVPTVSAVPTDSDSLSLGPGRAPLLLRELNVVTPAQTGDVVAVLGLGGLGHLGVQFSARMGFKTVAIARGSDKEPLARKLGAHHYIDSQAQDVAAELVKMGGAKVILATVTNGEAMSATLGG